MISQRKRRMQSQNFRSDGAKIVDQQTFLSPCKKEKKSVQEGCKPSAVQPCRGSLPRGGSIARNEDTQESHRKGSRLGSKASERLSARLGHPHLIRTGSPPSSYAAVAAVVRRSLAPDALAHRACERVLVPVPNGRQAGPPPQRPRRVRGGDLRTQPHRSLIRGRTPSPTASNQHIHLRLDHEKNTQVDEQLCPHKSMIFVVAKGCFLKKKLLDGRHLVGHHKKLSCIWFLNSSLKKSEDSSQVEAAEQLMSDALTMHKFSGKIKFADACVHMFSIAVRTHLKSLCSV